MENFVILQILADVLLVLCIYVLWVRLKKPPQDDPRLSKGLQLLQSKISVLEDLSDRTEVQVQQLVSLLDHKSRSIQQKVDEARQQINLVEQSMVRSREVAKIFQDKIPHQEIIERQNTIKYVKAAQWAHSGKTAAEIAQLIDLPVGEIEFICKVNKDQLMFDSNSLPEWAREPKEPTKEPIDDADTFIFKESAEDFEFKEQDSSMRIENLGGHEYSSLKKVGEDFRQACRDYEKKQEEWNAQTESGGILKSARDLKDKIIQRSTDFLHERDLEFQESDSVSSSSYLQPDLQPEGGNTSQSEENSPRLEIYMPETSHHGKEDADNEHTRNEFNLKKNDTFESSTTTTSFKIDHSRDHRNENHNHNHSRGDNENEKQHQRVIRKVEFPRIEKLENLR